MPRNGRIQLVGKWEAREIQERADALCELARELRRQWRLARRGVPVQDASVTVTRDSDEQDG